jgi:nickel/cobalt transporter (NicO) family protein
VTGPTRTPPGDWGWLDDRLIQLVDGGAAGLVAAAVAVGVAFGIGVVHALGPGHGKVLIGAHLAGTAGRRRDALGLGLLIAAMHTGSVLALGAAYLTLQRLPWGGSVSHALELAVAVAVVAVGGMTLRRARVRSHAPTRVEAAVPAAVGGTAVHGADHHHALPDGVAPLSRSGVLALAAAGGLVPSPSAFLVLVTAVALGRPWFGLALLGAFSAGLAVTLGVLGLAVLRGRDHLLRSVQDGGWPARVATALPTVAALAVMAAGLVMAGLAVARW